MGVAAWSLISMSVSFVGSVSISDLFSGPELGVKTAKMFGSIGLAIIVAPMLGVTVFQRAGAMNVFKLRLALSLVHLWFINKNIPETLSAEKRTPFRLTDVNPFSFLKLFNRSASLRVLVAAVFFHCFAEGKNVVPLMQSWLNGLPLRAPISKQSMSTTFYGVSAMASGLILVPKLMKSLGARGFTSVTNILNAVGLTLMGLPVPEYATSWWAGLLLHFPGVNNTSAAAMKAITTDHAVASGLGRGEYGGMYSSLRSLSMIIAPLIFGWAYNKSVKNVKGDVIPRSMVLPWFLAAFFGAVLPELLHRSLSDEELKPPAPATTATKMFV